MLNLLDLGIASTLTNHVARAYALNDKPYAARCTTNALALTCALAGTAGLVFAAAWPRIDWMALFNVAASVPRGEVNNTVAAAVAVMLFGRRRRWGAKYSRDIRKST